jgi:hypothetical protein
MIPPGTVFVATFLLALGVTSLALAVVAILYGVRDRTGRGGALAVLGIAALASMAYLLSDLPGGDLWSQLFLPLLVVLAAAGAGIAMGAGLVFILVAAR